MSLIFLKISLAFPIPLFSFISLHWSQRKAFLSLLAILWNSAFKWVYLSFSPDINVFAPDINIYIRSKTLEYTNAMPQAGVCVRVCVCAVPSYVQQRGEQCGRLYRKLMFLSGFHVQAIASQESSFLIRRWGSLPFPPTYQTKWGTPNLMLCILHFKNSNCLCT